MVADCGNKCLERGHRAHRISQATCTCDNPTIELRHCANCNRFQAKKKKQKKESDRIVVRKMMIFAFLPH